MQQNNDSEIVDAANHKIDVSIFTMLTRVPRGQDYFYLIDDNGVWPVAEDVNDIPARYLYPNKGAALSAMGESLAFPCTPDELVEWVKGTFGVFQLPLAFIKAVEAHAEVKEKMHLAENIDALLSTLPAHLREEARQSPYFGKFWDNLHPNQREKMLSDSSGQQNDAFKEKERTFTWWNLTMDALLWWQRSSIKPKEAAYLLYRYNPLNSQSGDPNADMTDETGPSDYTRLLRVFEDVHEVKPQHRSLDKWLQLAQQSGLKYHSWINDWLESSCLKQRQQSPNSDQFVKSRELTTIPWWQTRHDLDDMVNTFLKKDPEFYIHQKGRFCGKAHRIRLANGLAERINLIEQRDGRTNRIDFESIRAYLKPLKI